MKQLYDYEKIIKVWKYIYFLSLIEYKINIYILIF
jgi:hypothetical protein